MHPYSSIDTTAAWKKLRFILSVKPDFHMTDTLLIAVHAFISRVSMSFSVDEILLPKLVNLSTSFRELPPSVEMSPVWLKHIYSVLCALTWRPMPAAARTRVCSSVSSWTGILTRIAMSSASVIVFAGYLLLFFFVSSKPFSLILSIDVLSTLYWPITSSSLDLCTQCYFKTSLSTSASRLGALNRRSLWDAAPSGSSHWLPLALIQTFTDSTDWLSRGICIYHFVTPTTFNQPRDCFRIFTLVRLVQWSICLMAQPSINMQHFCIFFNLKVRWVSNILPYSQSSWLIKSWILFQMNSYWKLLKIYFHRKIIHISFK